MEEKGGRQRTEANVDNSLRSPADTASPYILGGPLFFCGYLGCAAYPKKVELSPMAVPLCLGTVGLIICMRLQKIGKRIKRGSKFEKYERYETRFSRNLRHAFDDIGARGVRRKQHKPECFKSRQLNPIHELGRDGTKGQRRESHHQSLELYG